MTRDQMAGFSTKLVKKYVDALGTPRHVGIKANLKNSQNLGFPYNDSECVYPPIPTMHACCSSEEVHARVRRVPGCALFRSFEGGYVGLLEGFKNYSNTRGFEIFRALCAVGIIMGYATALTLIYSNGDFCRGTFKDAHYMGPLEALLCSD